MREELRFPFWAQFIVANVYAATGNFWTAVLWLAIAALTLAIDIATRR